MHDVVECVAAGAVFVYWDFNWAVGLWKFIPYFRIVFS